MCVCRCEWAATVIFFNPNNSLKRPEIIGEYTHLGLLSAGMENNLLTQNQSQGIFKI